MDLGKAIADRRSYRKLSVGPVKEEDLLAMLEAARQAPSDENSQPWHFYAIRDSEFIARMADKVNAAVEVRIAACGESEARAKWENVRFFMSHFGRAPVIVAVAFRRVSVEGHPVDELPQRDYSPGLQSIGAAIQNLILTATSLGYGTCWMTGPVDAAKKELEAILGLEEPWLLVSLVPIGLPTKTYPPRPRKDLAEIVTFIG